MPDIAEMTVFHQGIKISWHVVPLGQRTRVMDRQTELRQHIMLLYTAHCAIKSKTLLSSGPPDTGS